MQVIRAGGPLPPRMVPRTAAAVL